MNFFNYTYGTSSQGICQILIPAISGIVGVIVGGLIGLVVQLVIESRKNKKEKKQNVGKFISYLIASISEIETAIEVLEKEKEASEIPYKYAYGKEVNGRYNLLSTFVKDNNLFALGELPLDQASEAMKLVFYVYSKHIEQINSSLNQNKDKDQDQKRQIIEEHLKGLKKGKYVPKLEKILSNAREQQQKLSECFLLRWIKYIFDF